jgi:hypothetical protein
MFTQLDGSVSPLANEDLLKLFEHMNGGRISTKNSPKTSEKRRREKDSNERESDVIEDEREIPVAEIKKRLEQMHYLYNIHDYLISKNIFRVGPKIQCPSCKRRSWYSLEYIKEQITCPKCLNNFLAVGNIDDSVWCYKTAGPFSIPRYADGGYCVLLATDFFSDRMTLHTTSAFSFEATDSKGSKLEADFAILWQESMFDTVTNGTVFGECKTFGEFKAKDLAKMKFIADKFPGSILAFCTLRKELTKNEIREIAKLTKERRKYWKDEKPINPVLILTGNELLGHSRPPYCWRDMGLTQSFDHVHGLLEICNATQQIYLGLSSWWNDWHEEFEQRRIRRTRRKSGSDGLE